MPYAEHPELTTPDDNVCLWRYMDFARSISLLESRVLWLSRADQFEDSLEGTLTDGELKKMRGSEYQGDPIFSEDILNSLRRVTRNTIYVNC
jgi:hypothetical protein